MRPIRLIAISIILLCGCTSATPPETTTDPVPGKAPRNAKAFLEDSAARLQKIQDSSFLAEWIKSNFITQDTTALSSQIGAQWTELATQIAKDTKNYKGADPNEQRKLDQFLLHLTVPGPASAEKNTELSQLKSELESMYGSGKYCDDSGDCQSLEELSETMESSRKPEELLDAWVNWRSVSIPMRPKYQRTVELGNIGATELGFKDMSDLWKSKYDSTAAAFETSLDTIWADVKPFYEQLHCYVRAQLNKTYGDKVVAKEGPIPAHLLGNMWAQSWANIYDLMATGEESSIDLTKLLQKAKYSPKKMVETAENFFVSLGMPKLPTTFYERSLFEKPRDRDVVCHASAWHMDGKDDVRIKMCIKIDDDNFRTIHHELGHIYYYLAYQDKPMVFQNSANDGFHEAMGDTLELSITPKYLKALGLLSADAKTGGDISYLMRMALGKVAFLPFGLMVDKWRWQVFSGELSPEQYNQGWWNLREKYQGIKAPVERPADAFDPGAKYHIPAYTPYSRYFLAHILQFQFHKALCQVANHKGPLHECSIYDSKEAGAKMWEMMKMGSSRPWPEALQVMTGSPKLEASALRDYFAPLEKWLVQKNKGMQCGW